MSRLGQKIEWKDTTPYSQGGSRKPRIWTAKVSWFRVSIIRGPRDYPTKWVLTIPEAGVEFDPMFGIDLDDHALARETAMKTLRDLLGRARDAVLET